MAEKRKGRRGGEGENAPENGRVGGWREARGGGCGKEGGRSEGGEEMVKEEQEKKLGKEIGKEVKKTGGREK